VLSETLAHHGLHQLEGIKMAYDANKIFFDLAFCRDELKEMGIRILPDYVMDISFNCRDLRRENLIKHMKDLSHNLEVGSEIIARHFDRIIKLIEQDTKENKEKTKINKDNIT